MSTQNSLQLPVPVSKNFISLDLWGDAEVRADRLASGECLFNSLDICRALDFKRPSRAVKEFCIPDGCHILASIDSLGREQHTNYLTAGNVVRLVSRSKTPKAQAVERWLFDEAIPRLLHTGHYEMHPEGINPNVNWPKSDPPPASIVEKEKSSGNQSLIQVTAENLDNLTARDARRALNKAVRRSKNISPTNMTEMGKLYTQGWSVGRIAGFFKITRETAAVYIKVWCKGNGVLYRHGWWIKRGFESGLLKPLSVEPPKQISSTPAVQTDLAELFLGTVKVMNSNMVEMAGRIERMEARNPRVEQTNLFGGTDPVESGATHA